jgi:muramoyltetrapeptide carboxypeptidase
MRKPRPLQPGDHIAIVAPASSFAQDQLHAGIEELRSLGFVPVYDERSLFERTAYTAGSAAVRAAALRDAWLDPGIAAVVAARGGYGSVHLLPLLDADEFSGTVKPFIAYSDNTSLLAWLTLTCDMVTFHGPMIDRRLARGPAGYDRDTFLRCLTRPAPIGVITSPGLEVIRHGEANGMLTGGTITQLAASLGTPFAFDPPQGCVLFLDEVAERPYRIDRLLTQLKFAGILQRAGALVFNELPRCNEPGGSLTARDVVIELTQDFNGPVLFGLPSGHGDGATLTIPFGVRARIETGNRPGLIIDESAVQT